MVCAGDVSPWVALHFWGYCLYEGLSINASLGVSVEDPNLGFHHGYSQRTALIDIGVQSVDDFHRGQGLFQA
jgi:hypothetical protein